MTAAVLSAVLVFPRSCQAVGLGVWTGCRAVLLPALWPAAFAAASMVWVQRMLPGGMVPTLTAVTVGIGVYAVVVGLFGIDREERQWCLSLWKRVTSHRAQRWPAGDVVGEA